MSAILAPIIIKKKKIVKGTAHHGGAWKVAYADFVTAMMAFFLLMWLLNATTEDQRKGLADYFDPSVPIARVSGGGNDALEGSSMIVDDDLAEDGVAASDRFTPPAPDAADAPPPSTGELERIQREINDRKASIDDAALADHIETRMTPDGLVVELLDREGSPLFDIGSANPSPLLRKLLLVVAPVLATVENPLEIIGHTDSRAYSRDARYSNWELSADRATTARRMLLESGLEGGQICAVIGKADVEPIASDPLASQNRRIAILLKSVAPVSPRLRSSLSDHEYNSR